MKEFTKIAMAIILMLTMCITIIPAEKADAKSKNIYFAGEYRKKIGKGEYYVLKTNQFSSRKGKAKGTFTIYYYYKLSGGMNVWKKGNMKQVSKNKYKSGKMRLRVYKKKIVITKGGEYNGIYKLKKRHYP